MKSATRSGISSKIKAEGTTLPSSKGLSTAQAELSRQKHGSNVLKVKKPKSFIRRFFENLGDPVIRILLLALAVDLIFVFRESSTTVNNLVLSFDVVNIANELFPYG